MSEAQEDLRPTLLRSDEPKVIRLCESRGSTAAIAAVVTCAAVAVYLLASDHGIRLHLSTWGAWGFLVLLALSWIVRAILVIRYGTERAFAIVLLSVVGMVCLAIIGLLLCVPHFYLDVGQVTFGFLGILLPIWTVPLLNSRIRLLARIRRALLLAQTDLPPHP